LRAGSGITIGLVGGVIGIHWSLGLSAITLAVVMMCLLFYLQRFGLAAGTSEAAPRPSQAFEARG
jgi:hypothetical protein